MDFQVNISTKSNEHLIEAAKVFWQSRGFKPVNQNETEITLVRGIKGYKWIAINPFKYYFVLKCQVKTEGENSEVICNGSTEADLTKNVFRDILIKSEFQRFENYLKAFTVGKPFNLKDISQIKLKAVWPQYILNLLLPGLGLLFTGDPNGIIFGILAMVYSIISIVSYTTSDIISSTNFFGSLVFWVILAAFGHLLVVYGNYEKIYEFDNEK